MAPATTYKDLIELVAHRELGILGKAKTHDIFREAGLPLGDDNTMSRNDAIGIGDLERLMKMLNDKYGAVAVMGCKITVKRVARQAGLKLPIILE